MLLALPFGLLIGLVVGSVGGGGAILALPVLVYVLDEGVGPATTASLLVVALAAALGAGAHARHGEVCWRIALTFALPAAVASLPGAAASAAVSPQVLILAFVPVMLVAAAATWRRAADDESGPDDPCPAAPLGTVLLAGAAVGFVTGFFGVGGGFAVVPALTLLLSVGMHRAVATSLVIVALTALGALASHLATGAQPDVAVTSALAVATGAGALIGAAGGRRLPQEALGRIFAAVVVIVAAFLFVDVVAFGGPPTA